jgi:large subunit ribosomal protein L10
MARPEKILAVEEIAGNLKVAQSVVLIDYSGLTVEQITEFRVKCRELGVICKVVKNSLAKLAATEADVGVLNEHISGPTAFLMGPDSQVDPAKLAVEFSKSNEAMEVKGGFLDGAYMDTNQIIALSKIPGRDELYAKMMGSMTSPLSGIVGTVNGVIGALTRVINAVSEQKEA